MPTALTISIMSVSLQNVEKRATSMLRNLRFPEPWYQTDVATELIAESRFLKVGFAVSAFLCAAAFTAQIIYYSQVTLIETLIHGEYVMKGFECRPLTPDPSYKLRISYTECMEQYYNPPTQDNLLKFGWYYNSVDGDGGKNSFEDRAQMRSFYKYNGPWNFSYGYGKIIDEQFASVYHRPFASNVSNTSYTFAEQCKIPRWKGYEDNDLYDPDISFQQPLEMARENAKANSPNYFSGYGEFGLSNFNVSWDDYVSTVFNDQSAAQKLLKFEVDPAISYTEHCGQGFAAVEQDLLENKTWAFHKVWGSDYTHTFFNRTSWKVQYTLRLADRSVGITPLYPEESSKRALQTDEYTNMNIDESNIQCDFFEKQVALEAYEYIYSWPNCHPCDVYKFSAPYECTRVVSKDPTEILSLSVANTMALWGILVSAGAILFSSSYFQKSDEETVDEPGQL